MDEACGQMVAERPVVLCRNGTFVFAGSHADVEIAVSGRFQRSSGCPFLRGRGAADRRVAGSALGVDKSRALLTRL